MLCVCARQPFCFFLRILPYSCGSRGCPFPWSKSSPSTLTTRHPRDVHQQRSLEIKRTVLHDVPERSRETLDLPNSLPVSLQIPLLLQKGSAHFFSCHREMSDSSTGLGCLLSYCSKSQTKKHLLADGHLCDLIAKPRLECSSAVALCLACARPWVLSTALEGLCEGMCQGWTVDGQVQNRRVRGFYQC